MIIFLINYLIKIYTDLHFSDLCRASYLKGLRDLNSNILTISLVSQVI